MKPPRKAFVLAAGFGARLLPLTLTRPKALFPVWGTPILRHTLELLREWGVREALINLHCHAGQVADYLRLNPVKGLRCTLSFEPDLLETGGSLRRARWWFDDAPFWMINADVLADISPAPFLRAFALGDTPAVLWMKDDAGPRTVEMADGRILNFRSQHPGAPGTCTFCGLQLLSPRLFGYFPDREVFSIVEVYERAMKKGEILRGVSPANAYWADIGTPPAYLAAHRDTKAALRRHGPGSRFCRRGVPGGPERASTSSVGPGCRIADGAILRNAVLWNDVTAGSEAVIQDAVVADRVTVNAPVSYVALRADALHDPLVTSMLDRIGWPLRQTVAAPFPPRGSARSFTRLRCGRRSAILVRFSEERPENLFYAEHARFLSRLGVAVPRIVLDFADQHACLMEDAGDIDLQSRVPQAAPETVLRWYREVLDNVLVLHARGLAEANRRNLPLSQPFSRHLYEWEQNLFAEQFLRRHTPASPRAIAAAMAELRGLIPGLLRARPVLVHRDLQSSNVLLRRGRPVLIDFQGMRSGAASYDLASLLCDPYVSLPIPWRERLLAHYAERSGQGAEAIDLFWTAAAERLVQALGAFGRLGATAATARFRRHIPAGIAELLDALNRIDKMPTLDEILREQLHRLRERP